MARKTLDDFFQRLQDDPKFEKKVQAFKNNIALMNFVRIEGYDFTLDELMVKFRQRKTSSLETVWLTLNKNSKIIIGLIVISGILIFTLTGEKKPLEKIDTSQQNISQQLPNPSIPDQQILQTAKPSNNLFVNTLKAEVRNSPDERASVIAGVTMGQKVIELKREGGWIQVGIKFDKVRNDYKYVGWIQTSLLGNRDEILRNMRLQIDTDHTQLHKLELEIKSISANIEDLKRHIDIIRNKLKNDEKQGSIGYATNKTNYVNNIKEHDKLVMTINNLLLNYYSLSINYINMIDQDKILLNTYNEIMQ